MAAPRRPCSHAPPASHHDTRPGFQAASSREALLLVTSGPQFSAGSYTRQACKSASSAPLEGVLTMYAGLWRDLNTVILISLASSTALQYRCDGESVRVKGVHAV
jgi:hypothetical protein